MTVRQSIDWTTPGAYDSVSSTSRLRRLAIAFDRLMLSWAIGRQLRRLERDERRLRSAAHEIPPYLRRDLGLPPHAESVDVFNYR